MPNHLREKRNEIMWALATPEQGYTYADIARMFNLDRSTTMRIIKSKPKNYRVKWVKSPDYYK